MSNALSPEVEAGLRDLATAPVEANFATPGKVCLRRWESPQDEKERAAFYVDLCTRYHKDPGYFERELRRLKVRDRGLTVEASPERINAFRAVTADGTQPCRLSLQGGSVVLERLDLGGIPGALARARAALAAARPNRFRVLSAAEFLGMAPDEDWLAI